MMKARVESPSFVSSAIELLCLPVFQGEEGAGFKQVDAALEGLASSLNEKEFSGKAGTAALVRGGKSLKRCLLYGLGKKADFNAELLRAAGGRLAAIAQAAGIQQVALWLPAGVDAFEGACAAVEGAALGAYKFDKYFTDAEGKLKPLSEIAIISTDAAKAKLGAEYGIVVSEAANAARELSNESGSEATPAAMVQKISEIAKEHKLSLKVLEVADAKRMGMGAFLSVAAGSVQPAKIVVLEYRGAGAKGKPVALVGKGITFDSGGISIKPAANMEKMKHDKSGAAAVVGALAACSRLQLPVHVVGVCPLSENLPSGTATKPGDIVRAMNGKTIEVINTDAEGRLVLADALAYAVKEFSPQAVIDLATLTGACFVALGDVCSGLMTNDAKLAGKVKEAGEKEGERCWELPMYKEYEEKIKSACADIKNVGGPMGDSGTIAGAVFLKNFVGETPWVHLDIAGTAWADKEKPYYALGATGVGTRLLARMLKEWR